MRSALIISVFLLFVSKCLASPDDTLPKGISSRFLAFPFVLQSPETKWGFGIASAYFFKAKKNEDKLRTSDVNIISLYTLRKQVVVVLGSTIFFPGERKIFRLQSSYSYYPDKFWGIGNNTEDFMKEDYSLKQLFINPQLIFNIYKKLFVGFSIELQDVNDFTYRSGSVFDQQNITGRNGGFTAGAGMLITWDTRNNAYSPSRGVFAELNTTRFTEVLNSDFNFTCYTLDIRKFMPAGRNRVLGLQSYTRINQGEAPVRYLSMIGGTEMMRGYYKGRYADKNLIAFQSEIRQYLFWRFGLAAFAAVGQVNNSLNEFAINEFHFSYGGGIRFLVHEKEKLNLRVDFGFGKKSNGIYVLLKEAF